MADEAAWLIERADLRYPDCVTGDFLGFSGVFDGFHGNGKLSWLSSAHDALRFSRREDAAKFICAFLLIQDQMPHKDALPGFRSGDARPLAVEHLWTDAHSSATT